MINLPTPWQQFYNSGFRYRPIGTGLIVTYRTSSGEILGYRLQRIYKTNKAKWAKQ